MTCLLSITQSPSICPSVRLDLLTYATDFIYLFIKTLCTYLMYKNTQYKGGLNALGIFYQSTLIILMQFSAIDSVSRGRFYVKHHAMTNGSGAVTKDVTKHNIILK